MTSRLTASLSTRARRIVAVSCALLVGSVALPSSAATVNGAIELESPMSAAASELPPSSGFVLSGIVSTTQVTVARSAKMAITIDESNPTFGLLRYGRWNAPLEDPVAFDQAASRVPWPFEAFECATVPVEEYAPGSYTQSDLTFFTVTPGGAFAEVGQVASVKVNLLAFGSIPSTATVTLSMAKTAGRFAPWIQHTWIPGEAPGCDLGTIQKSYRALVEGQADLKLSDLEIDGVPVNLGPACQTSRPVEISLWGEEGYEALAGGFIGQYDGLATGTRVPLISPYYFEQEGRMIADSTGLDIPPFVGCGSGGEDLSDIVTAMASGPNNPVRVAQGNPTKVPYDPDNILACDVTGACPIPAPAPPAMPPLPNGETP